MAETMKKTVVATIIATNTNPYRNEQLLVIILRLFLALISSRSLYSVDESISISISVLVTINSGVVQIDKC